MAMALEYQSQSQVAVGYWAMSCTRSPTVSPFHLLMIYWELPLTWVAEVQGFTQPGRASERHWSGGTPAITLESNEQGQDFLTLQYSGSQTVVQDLAEGHEPISGES